MTTQLFKRVWRITVGTSATTGLQLEDVDVSFQVKKTLKPEPNTCDLKIYNLTSAHQKQIEQNPGLNTLKKVVVKIEAGLGGQLNQIFLGELRAGFTESDGADQVTQLSTGSGEKEMATSRLNLSFGAGTPISAVLQEMAATLGVGTGNMQQALQQLQNKGLVQFSMKGQVLKGNVVQHVNDLCKSCGLEWSVQDSGMQFLLLGQPLAGQAIQLDSSSGMIGSPSVDSKGVMTVETLMIPGIAPGVVINMNAQHCQGGYKITTVETKGDSLGNEWGHKIQATVY